MKLTVLVLWVALPCALPGQDTSAPVVGRAAQADAIYRQGIAALQQRDLVSARAAFEKAVQLQPRSPEGHNSLGWVLLAQKQVDLAIAQFQAALDLRMDFFQAHMNLSSAYLLKGDRKRGAPEGREAVRFAPTESEAYRTLARALDASSDVAGAVKQMRHAVELDPGRPELHDELGTLLVRETSMAPATAASGEEAGHSGADADSAKATSGTASMPPPQNAENEFAEALRLQPELASAHLHLGVLKFQEKALDQAIPHLQDAVRLDAENAQAHFYLAQALRLKGDQDGALREVAVAVKLQPHLIDGQNLLGLLEQRSGNADQAVAAFREVVKAEPENADAHNNLGLALLQMGDANTAITEFQAALHARPHDTGYETNLGVAYLQKTDFDAAMSQFEGALKTSPQDPN